MNYVCIRCGYTWLVGESTEEPSGGLCDGCITKYVREKQTNQGLHDCFRRAEDNCSETECSYWGPCNRDTNNFEDEKKEM